MSTFGFTPEYILHHMTFGQGLTLLNVHNQRELRAQDRAKREAKYKEAIGVTEDNVTDMRGQYYNPLG